MKTNHNLILLKKICDSLKDNSSNFSKFIQEEEHEEKSKEYNEWEECSARDPNWKVSWIQLIKFAKKLNEVKDASRYEILNLVYELLKPENDFYDYRSLQSEKNAKYDFNDLYKKWYRKCKLHDEKWHEFVRLSQDFEKFVMMRNSLLEIIFNNQLLKNKIFEFKFDEILTKLPDRKARLQHLEQLYDRFIPIYKKIITQISFENKYIKSEIPYPKGIVLWNETILRSKNSTNSQIISLLPKREFDTPENTFLSLCMEAILQKIIEIQAWKRQEKFDNDEISIISKISFGIQQLIKFFPFLDTIVATKNTLKKLGLQNSLNKYYKITNEQLYKQAIRNKQYNKLLYWYQDFKNEINLIDELKESGGNWLTESTRSIDTLYEYYIFFNIMDNFSKQENCNVEKPKWNINSNEHYFDFHYNGSSFRFNLSYEIKKEHSSMLLRKYNPDFMIQRIDNNQNIIVMDAKNTSDNNDKLNYKHILENYMYQSNSKNGMIIWGAKDSPSLHLHNSKFKWDFCTLSVPMKTESLEKIHNEREKNLSKIRKKIFAACDGTNCTIN